MQDKNGHYFFEPGCITTMILLLRCILVLLIQYSPFGKQVQQRTNLSCVKYNQKTIT